MSEKKQHESPWSVRHKLAEPAEQDWQVCQNIPWRRTHSTGFLQPLCKAGSLCKAGLCSCSGGCTPGCYIQPPTARSFAHSASEPLMQIDLLTSNTFALRSARVQDPPRAGHRSGAPGAQLSSSPLPKTAVLNPWLFYEVSSGTLQAVVKLVWRASLSKLPCTP